MKIVLTLLTGCVRKKWYSKDDENNPSPAFLGIIQKRYASTNSNRQSFRVCAPAPFRLAQEKRQQARLMDSLHSPDFLLINGLSRITSTRTRPDVQPDGERKKNCASLKVKEEDGGLGHFRFVAALLPC